jgi:hypothetical protein
MRLAVWTPEYPGAIVYPADRSNCLIGVGWEPVAPTHIVYHTPQEKADTTPSTPVWFAQDHGDPNMAGSTNAFADWLGNIWECVPPYVTPIANGVLGKPYPPGANPNINLNRASRSIEIEGFAHNIHVTMPRGGGQWNTVVKWGAYQSALHGIPVDRDHHVGHYEVATNRTDPGTLDLDQLVEDIKQGGDDLDVPKLCLEARAKVPEGGFVRGDGTPTVYKIIGGCRVGLRDLTIALSEGMKPDFSNVVVVNPVALLAWPENDL